VIRFVNLLREFGKTSQFIVITHNKKTVIGADALLGVTMEESGVTKVIAVRLERSDGKPVGLPDEIAHVDDEDVEYEAGRELTEDPAAEAAARKAARAAKLVAAEALAAETGIAESAPADAAVVSPGESASEEPVQDELDGDELDDAEEAEPELAEEPEGA